MVFTGLSADCQGYSSSGKINNPLFILYLLDEGRPQGPQWELRHLLQAELTVYH